MAGIPSAMWRDLRAPPRASALFADDRGTGTADESIASFFGRRFSPDLARRLIDPLISGIYAGDIEKLSMRSVFPSLADLEAAHGSVLLGTIREAMNKTKQQRQSIQPSAADSVAPTPASNQMSAARRAASVSFRAGMATFPNALRKLSEVRTMGMLCYIVGELGTRSPPPMLIAVCMHTHMRVPHRQVGVESSRTSVSSPLREAVAAVWSAPPSPSTRRANAAARPPLQSSSTSCPRCQTTH